jgi:hypothetical protein
MEGFGFGIDGPGDTEASEGAFEDVEGFGFDVGEGEFAACDGRGDEVAGRFNVVTADACGAACEGFDAFDFDAIGAFASDVGAHGIEHVGEVDDVGFARGIIEDGLSFCEDAGHQDVFCRGDAGFIEENARAFEFAFETEGGAARGSFCAECFEACEVCVEAAVANRVATGRRQGSTAGACEEWAREEEAGANFCRELGWDFGGADALGGEGDGRGRFVARDDGAKVFGGLEHRVDIGDIGDVGEGDRFGREEGGGNHRERGIFVAGHIVRSANCLTTLNEKFTHDTIPLFAYSERTSSLCVSPKTMRRSSA